MHALFLRIFNNSGNLNWAAIQEVFSLCLCSCPRTYKSHFSHSISISIQTLFRCLKTDTEFINWKIIRSQGKYSLGISRPKSNIIRISKLVLWIGINKSCKAISRWITPFFCSREGNWKTQNKPTFQTPVVLCFSVQQGISGPPERILLLALLFNKIILLEFVWSLFSCDPYNCPQRSTR